MVYLRIIDHHVTVGMLIEIDQWTSSLLRLSLLPFRSIREGLIMRLCGCSWIEVGVRIGDRVPRALQRIVEVWLIGHYDGELLDSNNAIVAALSCLLVVTVGSGCRECS